MVIYRIRNLVNGKFYIGSAKLMKARKGIHLYTLRRQKHHSSYLQAVYNKYGEENLKFEVLRKDIEDNKELLLWEQRYIDQLNPEYNILRTAGNTAGRKLSPEHRRRLLRTGIPPTNKGIPMSIAQRRVMSRDILCIETNIRYESTFEASLAHNTGLANIRKACRLGTTANKHHFKFIN